MAGLQSVTLTQSRTRERIPIALEPGQPHIVGSSTACDTAIDSTGVQARHAEFRWRDGALWLTPIGDAAVRVNGERARTAVVLADGDWVAFAGAVHRVGLRERPGRQPRIED